MEKFTMLKTEVQPNGDIFVYYVDENGDPVETTDGVITAIDPEHLQQLQENYTLEEISEELPSSDTKEVAEARLPAQVLTDDYTKFAERWLDDEIEKLLIFYVDNKEAFQNPFMKKIHLWNVACKTMLVGKTPKSCEMKLRNLKRKYSLLQVDYLKKGSNPKTWSFYDLCHQAFEDDSFVKSMLIENGLTEDKTLIDLPATKQEDNGTVIVKKNNKSPDENVRQMLELYLQYKKESGKSYSWQKEIWKKISLQLGEDAEFWHKRFLNYKQHYIRMLEKRKESGAQSISWPYMSLYDEIYADDMDFKRKYAPLKPSIPQVVSATASIIGHPIMDWNQTEKTVLVKYYFDCFEEFQDPSIPNGFLWNEVGRLLDKKPEDCRKKYEEMKKAHLNLYIGEGYNLPTRKPIEILFDNIISQEVEKKLSESNYTSKSQWESEKLDELVKFMFDKIEIFKDPVCHFVCWAAIAEKLKETIEACNMHWIHLTSLYKSILNDKKEDPDLQIEWRYIDLFDRIFDYGMDTKLLEGYVNKVLNSTKPQKKITVKTETPEDILPENLSDLETEEFDERSSGKRSRGTADPKQMKILEYYLKNRDKFASSQRRKQILWEALANDIGISAEQCAHRFRNLKQVYMAYIQREISKPDKPILWPYYALCKKVFGYRALRNKLKNNMETGDEEDWAPKEIKLLINHFKQNFKEIDANTDNLELWATVAQEIQKSKSACRDKFLDLRKSFRKIVTMMNRNPGCKINWKYYKYFYEIYSGGPQEGMDVDTADQNAYVSLELPSNAIKTEIQGDDDLQCIIVIPEDQKEEKTDVKETPIIINAPNNPLPEEKKRKQMPPWDTKMKVQLLDLYTKYLEEHKGKLIDVDQMWSHIDSKMKRGGLSCKRMYIIIKTHYKKLVESNNENVIKKSKVYSKMPYILSLKPKFVRPPCTESQCFVEQATYKDVELPLWKVEKALKYYLEHVEEFVSPKYDKKHVWLNLAKSVPVLPGKIFRKINYLKQFYNSDTNEVNGVKFEFADTLKEILEKEFYYRISEGNIPEVPMSADGDVEMTEWTDDDTEKLLLWYLENLEQFKNPIFASSNLWAEAANVLNKGAVACSDKMNEIRSQYSTMVKENSDALTSWRFYELCQKIYGTGKKSGENENDQDMESL